MLLILRFGHKSCLPYLRAPTTMRQTSTAIMAMARAFTPGRRSTQKQQRFTRQHMMKF